MKRSLAMALWLLAVLVICTPGAAPASSISLQGATIAPVLTTAGDPDGYVVNPPSFYDGVAKVIVSFPSSATYGGSATLLWNNQYLLTAAHMVMDEGKKPTSFSATFNSAGGLVTRYGTEYFIHPDYNGDFSAGNDIAVVKLISPVPLTGYQIYRNAGIDEVANLAGYGKSGTGLQGSILDFGTLRQGQNRYEAYWVMPGAPYAFDFDDGTAARDSLGILLGIHNLGAGLYEVDTAPGDSGGPGFIDDKIAGIHSFIATFGSDWGDLDDQLNSTFGELGGDTRVAAYANWIDTVVPIPLPGTLVLLGSGLAGLLAWGRWRRFN